MQHLPRYVGLLARTGDPTKYERLDKAVQALVCTPDLSPATPCLAERLVRTKVVRAVNPCASHYMPNIEINWREALSDGLMPFDLAQAVGRVKPRLKPQAEQNSKPILDGYELGDLRMCIADSGTPPLYGNAVLANSAHPSLPTPLLQAIERARAGAKQVYGQGNLPVQWATQMIQNRAAVAADAAASTPGDRGALPRWWTKAADTTYASMLHISPHAAVVDKPSAVLPDGHSATNEPSLLDAEKTILAARADAIAGMSEHDAAAVLAADTKDPPKVRVMGHQLDAAISGAVLMPLTGACADVYRRDMAAGRVRTTFMAVMEGIRAPRDAKARLEKMEWANKWQRIESTVYEGPDSPPQTAVTDVCIVNVSSWTGTIALLRPVTNYKHQLRQLCAQELRAPMYGDTLFGTHGNYGEVHFIGLHAYQLEWEPSEVLPGLGEKVEATAAVPRWWWYSAFDHHTERLGRCMKYL